MKKLFAIAVTVLASAYPIAGYAAMVSVSGGSSASAATSSAGMSAGLAASASASLSSKSSFSDVMASASSTDIANVDLSQLGPKTVVHIVKLSKLKGYSAGASMSSSTAVTANRKSLDANVAANAHLVAKLKAAGFTADQVVAESSTKASVTLFVDDKA